MMERLFPLTQLSLSAKALISNIPLPWGEGWRGLANKRELSRYWVRGKELVLIVLISTTLFFPSSAYALCDSEVEGHLEYDFATDAYRFCDNSEWTYLDGFNRNAGAGYVFTPHTSDNVGIGTNAPSSKLHIYGNNVQLTLQDSNSSGNVPIVFLDDTSTEVARIDNGVGQKYLTFGTDGSERVRIDSSGNVGIGDTDPIDVLEVAMGVSNESIAFGSSSSAVNFPSEATSPTHGIGISRTTDGSYANAIFAEGTSAQSLGIKARNDLKFYGNQTLNMIIEEAGDVGIQTSTPQVPLQIGPLTGGDATAQERLRLTGDYSAVGSGALLRFTNQHNSGDNPNSGEYNLAAIAGIDSTNNWGGSLHFYTVDTGDTGGGALVEAIVIDNDQNVGIGVSDPAEKLEIQLDGAGRTLYTGQSGTNNKYAEWNISTITPGAQQNSRSTVYFRHSGESDPVAGIFAQHNSGDLTASDLYFATGYTTDLTPRLTIQADGDIQFNDFGTCSALETVSGVLTCGTDDTAAVAADSLDFDDFTDTMALDASTDIAIDGTEVLSITNTGTGNSLLVNDEASDTSPISFSADGNIGVGTSAPGSRKIMIEVDGNNQGLRLDSNTATQSAMVVFNDSTNVTSTDDGMVRFHMLGSAAGTTVLSIRQDDLGNFLNVSSGDDTPDIFVIENSGNVGIGKSDPGSLLTVLGGDIVVREDDDGNDGIVLQTDNGNSYIDLNSGGTTVIHLDSTSAGDSYINNGDFAVGTATALSKMHVRDATTGFGNDLLIEHDAATGDASLAFKITADDTDAYKKAGIAFEQTDSNGRGKLHLINDGADDTGNATLTEARMTIDKDGNVGIGVTDPESNLQIGNNVATGALDNFSEYQLLLFENTTASTSYGMGIISNTFKFNSDNDYMWDVDGSTVMTLDNGSLGIGTPTPQRLLHVSASADAYTRLETTGTTSGDDTLAEHLIAGTTANNYILFGDSGDSDIGRIRYNHASDFMEFRVNASTAVHIDSDGDVGIGDTSPDLPLHITGSSTTDFIGIKIQNSNGGGSDTTGAGIHFSHFNNIAASAKIIAREIDAADHRADLIFQTKEANVSGTEPTEKVRITYDGLVGINETNPSNTLDVNGSTRTGAIVLTNDTATYVGTTANLGHICYHDSNWGCIFNPPRVGSSGAYLFEADDGTDLIRIEEDGDTRLGTGAPSQKLDVGGNIEVNGSIFYVSDARMKKDIKPIQAAIEKLGQLNGVSYYWKDDYNERKAGLQYGFIAQEVEKVFPDIVTTDREGMKSLHYTGLIAPTVEAVKYLNEENIALKTEIEDLRNGMKDLEQQVTLLNDRTLSKASFAPAGVSSSETSLLLILLSMIVGGIFMLLFTRLRPQR